ncbi:MAG: hypothetical protein RL139_27 [Gemmatimonadota bacterium]
MTPQTRETAGAVRSAHVAYFLPPDWTRVARLAIPALERMTAEGGTRLLLLVPDAGAALALAQAVSALPSAAGHRIVAATTPARATRLLAAGPAAVVIGAPATLAPALGASALKLDAVTQVGFASADEMDADDPALAAVLAEVPKGAAKFLTALEATAGVEALLERHLHKARRVVDDVVPATGTGAVAQVRALLVAGAVAPALASVLDEVDAPSTTILAADTAGAAEATAVLRAIGYDTGALVQVAQDRVEAHAALVVLIGVPTATAWGSVVAAAPAQVVAIIPARQRAALQRLAGEVPVLPFAAKGAAARARAAEAKLRAEVRAVLDAGVPAREVLALEPLLESYDGLEIAAAALRLLERSRAGLTDAVQAAEKRVREAMTESARAEAPAREGRRDEGRDRDRPPRAGFAPRGERFERGPRSDRGDRGARPERGPRPDRGDRDDRGPRSGPPRSGPPRSGAPRSGPPRGGAPRAGGPRRDGPRTPR